MKNWVFLQWDYVHITDIPFTELSDLAMYNDTHIQ